MKSWPQGIRGHARVTTDFASWMLGIQLFFRFAVECGAVAERDAEHYLQACRDALYALMEDQDEHQTSQDEVGRFLSLLASALASGRCHAFDLEGAGEEGGKGIPHGPTKDCRAFGWIQNARGEYQPQGPCVGWLEKDVLYLDGESAHAVISKYAAEQGGTVSLTQRTLFTRIGERGLLARIETSKRVNGTPRISYQVMKKIHGCGKRVYALKLSALLNRDPENAG